MKQRSEEELMAEHAEKIRLAIANGDCPKCGSTVHVDHPEGRVCHNCGATFAPTKKGVTA